MSDETRLPKFSLLQKAGVFAPAAIGLTGVELFLQAPLPLEVAFLASAFVLAHKSPEIYASMRNRYPNMPAIAAIEKAHVQAQNKTDWSLTDKLLGKHMNGPYQQPQRLAQETRTLPENESTQVLEPENEDDINFPAQRSSFFAFSEVLRDFKPSLDRIYLGEKEDGTPIFCSARKLFHIALAGKTGKGKGSLMRLLLAQLCACRVELLLLNPHYMDWVYTDSGDDEDWTPFKPYFKVDPNDCVAVPAIEKYLRWAREVLLEKRKTKARNGQRPGKPFFIVIDELPSIIDESKVCADYISKLTNEGRKYGIFLIVASQNFQVKAVSGNTAGADRENYETCYYVGGDGTTAKVLLDMPVNQIPETSLGRGVAMLRCAGSTAAEKAVKVRVPFTDNEALYRLLGPSTFKKEATVEDDLSFTDLFEQMTGGKLSDESEQEQEIVDSPAQERMRLPEPMQDEEAQNIILGKDAFITKEQFRLAIKLREVGKSTGYRDLMDFFDLSEHHAKALNARIRQELGLEAK